MTIQNIPSKGRISVIKIQNFTIQKRQSLIRVVYGTLLFVLSIVMIAVDPVSAFSKWFLEMREGSYIYKMWGNPTYDVRAESYVFNYTNVDEFLSGTDSVLKLEEIGPFVFREHRTNLNMSVDNENGVLHMYPQTNLEFVPELSVGHYKDYTITTPSIAILAISTLLADKFNYITNAAAYYSMKALDHKLFKTLSVQDYFWGYHDPIVVIANRFLPGWIDFKKVGIMDRLYVQRHEEVELELEDIKKKYSIKSWAGSQGVKEQGFTNLNTSIPCNTLLGAYEGMMVAPGISKETLIPIYRRQACKVFPFVFQKEIESGLGFPAYRFVMEQSAFNNTSSFACECSSNCLPNGFVDIGNCYYGFPISISKPHFTDVDPVQLSYFEGLKPDNEKYVSKLDVEPELGVPISLASTIQVNLAIRSSAGNPLTKRLAGKVLPLLWLNIHVKDPPSDVSALLRLRYVFAPPIVIVVEIIMFVGGIFLCGQGVYRFWKPKYQLVDNREPVKRIRKINRVHSKPNNVVLNMSFNKGFKDDEELEKEAVSLLSVKEDYKDLIERDF